MGSRWALGYKESDGSFIASYVHWGLQNFSERVASYIAIYGLKKFCGQIDKGQNGNSNLTSVLKMIQNGELFEGTYSDDNSSDQINQNTYNEYEKVFIVNSIKTMTIYTEYGRNKELYKMNIPILKRKIVNNIFNGDK